MIARRLLFLTYHYTPQQAVAAIRTTSMARALASCGWRVTVVTVDPIDIWPQDHSLDLHADSELPLEVITCRHSFKFLHPSALKTRNTGLFKYAGGIARLVTRRLGLEREIGWISAARATIGKLLAAGHRFDALLCSGGPWCVHSLAHEISRTTGIPLIQDYRDLWNGNPYVQGKSHWALKTEAKIRAAAAAITAVSPSILAVQKELFGSRSGTHVITNGYDPQTLPTPSERRLPFILYSGQFYPPHRTFLPFLLAFDKYCAEHPDHPARLQYIGPSAQHVRDTIANHLPKHQSQIAIEDRVSRGRALELLSTCSIALVSASNLRIAPPAIAGIVTGKIFEIIGTRTPYLIISSENSDLIPIMETAGGGRAFCADNIGAISDYMAQCINGYPPEYKNPENYSWPALGKQMSRIMLDAIENENGKHT